METKLLDEIYQLNPWLQDPSKQILVEKDYMPRVQSKELLDKEWDSYWTILMGPRRAGKTTIGKFLSKYLIENKRYSSLLYLNCDYFIQAYQPKEGIMITKDLILKKEIDGCLVHFIPLQQISEAFKIIQRILGIEK